MACRLAYGSRVIGSKYLAGNLGAERTVTDTASKGSATNDWGGGEFIGTQTHLPQKFSLFSDSGQSILKMLENA